MSVRILSTSQTVGKLLSHTHGSSVEFCEATPIGQVDESKDPCKDVRRTETCVAPTKHVDASRNFYFYFLRTSSVGGRGVRCQTFSHVQYSFPCSADHERDWPPCKVVFSGWQPIPECEKQQQQQQQLVYSSSLSPECVCCCCCCCC